MSDKTDKLFSKSKTITPFTFDKSVAEVFPDMIQRSVPGYAEIIHNLEKFARLFVTSHSVCFDLGCSLGASSLAMSAGIDSRKDIENVRVIAVDNSTAMLERCQQHIDAFRHNTPIELFHGNIQDTTIQNASMVVLNFTLQFIPIPERKAMLKNIYNGMKSGGVMVLSEKICFEDHVVNELIIDLHHQFKKDNGYSHLEISQKRNALENVLVPEPLEQHVKTLKNIGFSSVNCWLQHYNFVSIFAIK